LGLGSVLLLLLLLVVVVVVVGLGLSMLAVGLLRDPVACWGQMVVVG
jgi:hypothetical protein